MSYVPSVELNQYVVVDEERILKCGGDHEFLQSLLKEFVEIYGGAPGKLRGYLANNEREEAMRLLHSIKGGSGNIGLQQIAMAAGDLEKRLKEQVVVATPAAIDPFEEAINNLCDYMQKKKQSEAGK